MPERVEKVHFLYFVGGLLVALPDIHKPTRGNSPKILFFSAPSPLIIAFSDLHKSQGGGRSQCASEQYTVAGNLLGELPVIVCLFIVCNLFVNSVAVLLFVVFC